MTPELPAPVKAAYDAMPVSQKSLLLKVRGLIFDCAESVGAGPVEEALRWGQPSYIAPKGSSLRLGVAKTGQAALFAHCQSSLISTFAQRFQGDFLIEGNRAVYLDVLGVQEQEKLRFLILHGLQYKLMR
nr:DUF1801 domain-containing protein [Amylibacter sp.]